MKNKTSSVPSVLPARNNTSLTSCREQTPAPPVLTSTAHPLHPKSVNVKKTKSGRGDGGVLKHSQTTEHGPNIWEDAWKYEIDHHAPALPAPEPGRNVVLFQGPKPPEAVAGTRHTLSESPLKRILADINARAMTPRQMQNLSLDLYVNGILAWDEHAELAFQVDLHPDFARTIGALTGEKALPDHPRDFVREWEQRLDFERRFAPAKSRAKERALHILSVLRRIEQPASLLA